MLHCRLLGGNRILERHAFIEKRCQLNFTILEVMMILLNLQNSDEFLI
uniref:Uncharacterized protein n=1 Tax=Anguilla anguilla TaxID=7936 RepID=A0A0E9XRB1_ANGAN